MDAFAEPGERSGGEHLRRAHEILRGKHQLADYVAGLRIEECASILTGSTTGLPVLAARRDECRVGPEEAEFRGGDPDLDARGVVRDRGLKERYVSITTRRKA